MRHDPPVSQRRQVRGATAVAGGGGMERKDVVHLAFHDFFERRQFLPEAP
jgi:hypothetical protein